jgi:hypothetical protein
MWKYSISSLANQVRLGHNVVAQELCDRVIVKLSPPHSRESSEDPEPAKEHVGPR